MESPEENRLELDLHELHLAYKITVNDKTAHVKSTAYELFTTEAQECFTIRLSDDYPQTAPQIQLSAHILTFKDKLPLNSDDTVDTDKLCGGWNAETNLVELANKLNVKIEMERPGVEIKVRDFAYPENLPSHYGRHAENVKTWRKAKALYDFNPEDSNELPFNVDEIIHVVYERSDGWIVGMLNGFSGLVPASYVTFIE